MDKPIIPVTKPFLPEQQEYWELLDRIWESEWLTNNGPLLRELEARIMAHLDIPYLQIVTNGTIALQLAIKSLDLKGEVITTPYSYVATTSSILWENCTPVFVDIEKNNFCINTDKIEDAISPLTSAILATHVYGLPCNVEQIKIIADRFDLKVIYDAAHAYGVRWKGQSLTNYGDVSTLSFHATKVFHSIEGGAVVSHEHILDRRIALAKAFGHRADDHIQLGINGKLSEFHAAMGLCILGHFEEIVRQRKVRWMAYKELLADTLVTIQLPEGLDYNYGYFPVVFDEGARLSDIIQKLTMLGIGVRRYFYPSLNKLPYLNSKESCPISESYADRIICLPLYHDLPIKDVEFISSNLKLIL